MSQTNEYFQYCNIKKIRFWRFFAFFALLIAILGVSISKFIPLKADYIAEIKIDGMIIDANKQAENILKLYDDKDAKAVIVAINSPGGTTYDSEILYDALLRVSKKKPVVAYMKNMAASGGYIVALSAEKIFAAKNTITGSIGVLLQVPNAKKLMDKIGVSVLEIKSSPIKGEPDYFSETPEAAINNLKSMVDDTNLWFANLVKERRPKIKPESFDALTNGSVYTGNQAVQNRLVDGIGGQLESKNYLISKYKLDKNIEITHKPLEENIEKGLVQHLLGRFSGDFVQIIKNILPIDIKPVDGLLSLWHS
jgi:protease IV